MTTPATGIRALTLIAVPTTSPMQDAAIAFYESLGFEKRTDIPMGDGYRWVEVYLPGTPTGIALAPPAPGTDVTSTVTGIILQTRDIDVTHEALRELGADVDQAVSRMGDPVPPLFTLRDPSGHSLMVVEGP